MKNNPVSILKLRFDIDIAGNATYLLMNKIDASDFKLIHDGAKLSCTFDGVS